ncbi:MAG TPA: enoyl-CoA hydratase/isomerase family protein [Solirubrobacterales bacterium]
MSVEHSLEGGVLTLTLARPQKLNAISPALAAELQAGLVRAGEDDVRVVLLRGAGRSFCAGADVRLALGADRAGAERFLDLLADVLRRIHALPKPVVAAVQGDAVGGGAELALEADLRIVADDARLCFPDVGLGSTPASAYQLVRHLGRARAMRMALLGEPLDAAEMEELGLTVGVVAPERLKAAAATLAVRLRDAGPARSLALAKQAVTRAAEGSREAELRANVGAMLACHEDPRQRAYVSAFGRPGADAQQ